MTAVFAILVGARQRRRALPAAALGCIRTAPGVSRSRNSRRRGAEILGILRESLPLPLQRARRWKAGSGGPRYAKACAARHRRPPEGCSATSRRPCHRPPAGRRDGVSLRPAARLLQSDAARGGLLLRRPGCAPGDDDLPISSEQRLASRALLAAQRRAVRRAARRSLNSAKIREPAAGEGASGSIGRGSARLESVHPAADRGTPSARPADSGPPPWCLRDAVPGAVDLASWTAVRRPDDVGAIAPFLCTAWRRSTRCRTPPVAALSRDETAVRSLSGQSDHARHVRSPFARSQSPHAGFAAFSSASNPDGVPRLSGGIRIGA